VGEQIDRVGETGVRKKGAEQQELIGKNTNKTKKKREEKYENKN